MSIEPLTQKVAHVHLDSLTHLVDCVREVTIKPGATLSAVIAPQSLDMLHTARDPVFTEAFGSSPAQTPIKNTKDSRQGRNFGAAAAYTPPTSTARFGVARDQQLQAEYEAERAGKLQIDMIPAPSIASYAPSSLNSPTNYRPRSISRDTFGGSRPLASSGFGASLSIDTSFGSPHFDDDMEFNGDQWSPKRRDNTATDALQDAGDLPSAVPAALAGSMSPTLVYLSQLARKKNRASARSADTQRGHRAPQEAAEPPPRARALDLFHGAAEYVALSGTATRRLFTAAQGSAQDSTHGSTQSLLDRGFTAQQDQQGEGGGHVGTGQDMKTLGQLLPAEVVNPKVKIQRNSFSRPRSSTHAAGQDDSRGNLLADALGAGQRGARAAPPRSRAQVEHTAAQLARTGGYYDYNSTALPQDYNESPVVPLLPEADPLEANVLRAVQTRGAQRAASPPPSATPSRSEGRKVQFPLTYPDRPQAAGQSYDPPSPELKYRGRLQRIRPRSARLPPHDPPSQAPSEASAAAARRQRPASAGAVQGPTEQRHRPPWRPAASTRRVADTVRRGSRGGAATNGLQHAPGVALAAPRSDRSARGWVDAQRRRAAPEQARQEAAAAVERAMQEAAAAAPAPQAGGDIEGTMYLLSILEDQDDQYEDELRSSGHWSPRGGGAGGGAGRSSESKAGTTRGDVDDLWRLRRELHAVVPHSSHAPVHQSASGSIPTVPVTLRDAEARTRASGSSPTPSRGGGSRQQHSGGESDGIDLGDDLRSVYLAHTDSYAADLAGAVFSNNMRHAAPGVRADAPVASRHEGGGLKSNKGVVRPSSAASSKGDGEAVGGEGGGTQFLRQRLRHLQRRAVLRALALQGASDSDSDAEEARASIPRLRRGQGGPAAASEQQARVPVKAVRGGDAGAPPRHSSRQRAITSLLRPDRDLAAFVRSASQAPPKARAARKARPQSAAAGGSPGRNPFGVAQVPMAPDARKRSARPASARVRRSLGQ